MNPLTPGVYRISQYGTHEQPQVLTLHEGHVTVFASGAAPERDQEWRLELLEDGKVAIQNPANMFPSHSLSYNGEPQEGTKIVPGPSSDFPTREWHVERAPQLPFPVPYFIRVPGKDLIVVVSPLRIFPPQLDLRSADSNLHHAWVFERVRGE